MHTRRTNPRPATVVSERAASSPACTAGLSARVRTGIHTFSPAVGRLEPIRDRLRSFQSEPHPALLGHKNETQKFTSCSPMINMISTPRKSGQADSCQARSCRSNAPTLVQKRAVLASTLLFFQTPFLQGSRCAGQHVIHEKIHRESKLPSQLSKKSLMKNLISAAHITSSSCLDKCNRFVSNFIPSSSTKCIFIITWTLNPAV